MAAPATMPPHRAPARTTKAGTKRTETRTAGKTGAKRNGPVDRAANNNDEDDSAEVWGEFAGDEQLDAEIANQSAQGDIDRRKRNVRRKEQAQQRKRQRKDILSRTKQYHSSSEDNASDVENGNSNDSDDSSDDGDVLDSDADSFEDNEFDLAIEEDDNTNNNNVNSNGDGSKESTAASLDDKHAKMGNAIAKLLGLSAGETNSVAAVSNMINTQDNNDDKSEHTNDDDDDEDDDVSDEKDTEPSKSNPNTLNSKKQQGTQRRENPILSKQKHLERKLDNAILESKAKLVIQKNKKKRDLASDGRIDYAALRNAQYQLVRDEFAARDLNITSAQERSLVAVKQLQTPQEIEHERQLRKTATRGVVKLFNAIRVAQTQAQQTEAAAAQEGRINDKSIPKLTKKSFLDVLRKDVTEAVNDTSKDVQSKSKETASGGGVSWVKDDYATSNPKHWDDAEVEEEDEEEDEEEEFE